MSFDWSTYRPRHTRNGFETAWLYFNVGVLLWACGCVIASILGVALWHELQPLFRIVW